VGVKRKERGKVRNKKNKELVPPFFLLHEKSLKFKRRHFLPPLHRIIITHVLKKKSQKSMDTVQAC
jgi:hypothetical protein